MTHRPSTQSTDADEPDTHGKAIAEATCATLVLVPAVLIVSHVVVGAWKPSVEPYALAAFFLADALFGLAVLFSALRRIKERESEDADDR